VRDLRNFLQSLGPWRDRRGGFGVYDLGHGFWFDRRDLSRRRRRRRLRQVVGRAGVNHVPPLGRCSSFCGGFVARGKRGGYLSGQVDGRSLGLNHGGGFLLGHVR
jgi:hypothetical protein